MVKLVSDDGPLRSEVKWNVNVVGPGVVELDKACVAEAEVASFDL